MDLASIRQFQEIDDAYSEALVTNDTTIISQYLDKNWVLVEGQFGVTPRDRFLAAIDQGRLSHTAMKKEVVRLDLRDDVAIVTSKGKNAGNFAGAIFDADQWVTSVYKKKSDGWICIVTQETPASC